MVIQARLFAQTAFLDECKAPNEVPIGVKQVVVSGSLNALFSSMHGCKAIRYKDGQVQSFRQGARQFLTWDSILPGLPMPETQKDCIDLVRYWRTTCEKIVGPLPDAPSVGNIAGKALKKFIDLPSIIAPGPLSKAGKAVEKACFGGRQEVYIWRATDITARAEDLPSAYRNAARLPLPCGGPRRVKRKCDVSLLLATVEIPCTFAGPLPLRSRRMGVVYPVDGELTGWWWENELEGLEYTVKDAIHFPARTWLKPLIEACEKHLLPHRTLQKGLKHLINVVIGLLAQTKRRKRLVETDYPTPGLVPVGQNMTHFVEDSPGGLPWTRRGAYGLITARIRRKMREALSDKDLSYRAIQAHTDGIIIEGAEKHPGLPSGFITKRVHRGHMLCPWPGAYWFSSSGGSQAPGLGEWTPGEEKLFSGDNIFGDRIEFSRIGPTRPSFRNRKIIEGGHTEPWLLAEVRSANRGV